MSKRRPLEEAPGWRVIERPSRTSWRAGYVIVPVALVVGALQVFVASDHGRAGWPDWRQASPSNVTPSTAEGADGTPKAERQLAGGTGPSAALDRASLSDPSPPASSNGVANGSVGVAPTPTRVFIHHRAGSRNAVPALQLAAYLQARGFAVTDIRAVDAQIEQPSVRYFSERDQPDSRRLVEAIAAFFAEAPDRAPDEAVDFSHLSSKPQQGHVEVWLPEPRDEAS